MATTQERYLENINDSIEAAKRMMEMYESQPEFHRGMLYNIRTQLAQAATNASELIGYLEAKTK